MNTSNSPAVLYGPYVVLRAFNHQVSVVAAAGLLLLCALWLWMYWDQEARLLLHGAECQWSDSILSLCTTEVFWSCAISVQLVTNPGRECLCAFPRRACPKEENSRGRKVKLLSEGNCSVPKAADVSPGSAGSVLLTPARSKGAETCPKRCRGLPPSCSLAWGVLRTDHVPPNLCLSSQGQGFAGAASDAGSAPPVLCCLCGLTGDQWSIPWEADSVPLHLLPFYCLELLCYDLVVSQVISFQCKASSLSS